MCGFRECRHFSRNSAVKKLGIKVETRVTRTLALWQFSLSSAKKSWHLKLRSVWKWMRREEDIRHSKNAPSLRVPESITGFLSEGCQEAPCSCAGDTNMHICPHLGMHIHACTCTHSAGSGCCAPTVCTVISPYTVTQVCSDRSGPFPLSW